MKTNENGATVLVVISVLAVLAVLTGAALEYTSAVAKNAKRASDMEAAAAIGRGCLEHEYMYWREICREYENPSEIGQPSSSFASIPLPTSTQFPNVPNFTATTGSNTTGTYTVSNYKIQACTPQFVPMSGTGTAPTPGYGLISQTGTTNVSFYYVASADVSLPERPNAVTYKARQVFEKQYVSPWEYAIFYENDLEINPGATMTINGMVQTNGNLYTGYNTLTFNDKVSFGGGWSIGFDPAETDHAGLTPEAPSWPSDLPPTQGAQQEPFGMDVNRLFSASNTNATSADYHQLIEIPTPGVADPIPNQRYYDQAGVKILASQTYNGNGSVASTSYTIYSSDSPTTPLSASTGSALDKALYNTFTSALSTSQITDDREGATVNLINVNMSKVNTAMTGTSLSGFNGIIYVANISADLNGGTPQGAVRLQNGATLPANGVTVASQNPVYIQGDYNTGVSPPSDSGTPTSPTASGYTRAPCAIAADAINVLSNNWNDANSGAGESSRVATSTTINAAFIGGIVPSSGGNYSGGLENFPRFLEDWGGQTFTYYGSMVQLYSSRQGIGLWKNASYGAPSRQWYFDTKFLTTPPPGSILVVNYKQGQWYQQ